MKILIVDDEPELRELYHLMLTELFSFELVEADNGQEAARILEGDRSIDLVVSDYNMPKAKADVIYKVAKEKGVPFILITSDSVEEHPEFKNQPLTGYLQKPFDEDELKKIVQSLLSEAQQYASIPLGLLRRIESLSVPIYLRLPSGRAIKVFQAGDRFGDEQEKHWKDKGVSHLLVSRSELGKLTHDLKNQIMNEMYFESLTKKAVEGIRYSQEIVEVLNGAIKLLSINEDLWEITQKTVSSVLHLMRDHTDIGSILSQFNDADNQGILVRSHLTALFCTWVVKQLSWNYPRSAEILSMAAFFHDIGLDDEIIKNEAHFIKAAKTKVIINRQQVEKVKGHILRALELLGHFKALPQEVKRVVEEHHEYPDGSGFPKGLVDHDISDLSALFIVTHEFVEMFFDPATRPKLKMEWSNLKTFQNYPRFARVHALYALQLEKAC